MSVENDSAVLEPTRSTSTVTMLLNQPSSSSGFNNNPGRRPVGRPVAHLRL